MIKLGNTIVRAVATPGHTPGAMSYFFNVTDGADSFTAGLHGGMGINTLCGEFLATIHSLRIRDFVLENHTDQPCAKFVNRGEIKNYIYIYELS